MVSFDKKIQLNNPTTWKSNNTIINIIDISRRKVSAQNIDFHLIIPDCERILFVRDPPPFSSGLETGNGGVKRSYETLGAKELFQLVHA